MKVFVVLFALLAFANCLPTKTRLPSGSTKSHLPASPAAQQKTHAAAQSPEEEPPSGGLMPYAFEYASALSSRTEKSDGDAIKGTYTINGEDGVQRIVNYIADKNGFRAAIATNEFGTESQAPSDVAIQSSQPKAQELSKAFGDSYIKQEHEASDHQQKEQAFEQKQAIFSTLAPALPAVSSPASSTKGTKSSHHNHAVKGLKTPKQAATKSVVFKPKFHHQATKTKQVPVPVPKLPQLPALPQKPIEQEHEAQLPALPEKPVEQQHESQQQQQTEQQQQQQEQHEEKAVTEASNQKAEREESTDSFGEQNSSFY